MKSNSGETIMPIPIPTSSSGPTIASEVVSRPWARITCRSHNTPPAAITARDLKRGPPELGHEDGGAEHGAHSRSGGERSEGQAGVDRREVHRRTAGTA